MKMPNSQDERDAIAKIQNLLKIKVSFANIEEIFVLPPSNLKGISPKHAEILEQFFQIETIEDLAKKEIDAKGFQILSKNNISKADWDNWKTAASLIYETPDFPREVKKVLVIGLDNAGKTSVINILQRELGLDTLLNIKPTRGIFREMIELQSLKMSLWDLSGQKQYREQFTVEEKNLIFDEVDIILLVVDIQASNRFSEIFEYLDNVINVLSKFQDQPTIIVLIHKADPDYIDTSEFRENYIGLRSVIDIQLEKAGIKYDYYITSIYNTLPKAQGFRESVKSTVDQLKSIGQTAVPSNILSVMTNIFDLVVKLSSILEDRMNLLEFELLDLQTLVQSEFIPGVKTIEAIEARIGESTSSDKNAKQVLVSELQKIITKRSPKPRKRRMKPVE